MRIRMSQFMRISTDADPDAELRYTSNINEVIPLHLTLCFVMKAEHCRGMQSILWGFQAMESALKNNIVFFQTWAATLMCLNGSDFVEFKYVRLMLHNSFIQISERIKQYFKSLTNHQQQNKWYPKGVYLPISKLHSILAIRNLLAHNNITISY